MHNTSENFINSKKSYNDLLIEAIENKDFKKAESYLKSGVKPIQTKKDELNLLALATSNNDLPMVNLLIEYGADPNERTYYSPTKEMTLENLCVNYECDQNTIHTHIDVALKDGVDILDANVWNEPIINIAIRNNNLSIVETLIQSGAEPNINPEDRFIEEPLVEAIYTNNEKLVSLLLENGADPQFFGSSSLLEAIKLKNRTIIDSLLENGSSTYLRLENGSTPILEALKTKDIFILKSVLLAAKSELIKLDLEIKDINSSLVENNKKILNTTSPSKKKSLQKESKKITSSLLELKDNRANFTEMFNDSIAFSVNENFNTSIIISLLTMRDLKDYSKLSKDDQINFVLAEKSKLIDEGVFKNLNKDKIEIIKNNSAMLIDNTGYVENTSYSPDSILLKSTYVQNPDDKILVKNLIEKLSTYKDPYIATLLTFCALETLKNDSEKLNIISSKSTNGGVDNIYYSFKDASGVTNGLSQESPSLVLFSPIFRESYASRVLLHEFTHNLIGNFKKNSSVDDCLIFNNNLNKAVKELQKTIKNANFQKKDKGLDYLSQMFQRLDLTDEYRENVYFNEDVLCDCLSYTQYNNRHKERNDSLKTKTTPLLNFADRFLFPKIYKLMLDDPNINKIILPTSVKQKLIEHYPKECTQKNITLTRLQELCLKVEKDLTKPVYI